MELELKQTNYGDFYIQMGSTKSTVLEIREEICRLWADSAIDSNEAEQLLHELDVECGR